MLHAKAELALAKLLQYKDDASPDGINPTILHPLAKVRHLNWKKRNYAVVTCNSTGARTCSIFANE